MDGESRGEVEAPGELDRAQKTARGSPPVPRRRRSLGDRARRLVRFLYYRLVRSKGEPRQVAFAFALGLFIGIMPGIGPIFAAAVCAAFRINIAACLLGVLLTNPLAFPFFYVGGPILGAWVFGLELPDAMRHPDSLSALWAATKAYFAEHGIRAVEVFGAGYGLLAGVPAAAGYGAAYATVRWYRRRRR